MSFDNHNKKKPKLVEPKLYNYYNEKLKKIKNDEITNKLVIEAAIESNTWYKKISKNIWKFIKENYGFFLIISLISILLYVRYIEVNSRKNKMKDAINRIHKEKEIQQFIELQEINKQLSQYA